MTTRLVPIWCCIASAGIFAAAGPSQASCNAIPDAQQTFAGTEHGDLLSTTIPVDLPYRGAFGRIDVSTLASGTAAFVTVGPNELCKDAPLRPLEGRDSVIPEDLVAMLFYEPLDTKNPSAQVKPSAQVYGSKKACDAIRPLFAGTKPPATLISCILPGGKVEIVSGSKGGVYRLKIHNSENGISGPVAAVVVSATAKAFKEFPVAELALGDCAGLGDDFLTKRDGYICIDTIYDDLAGKCKADRKFASLVPANLQSLPPPNDFQEQCGDADDADTNLASCADNPTELAFTVDTSGAVLVPFDWTEIKKSKTGPVKRVVQGRTATGKKKKGENPGIRIPGREFLGSTAPKNPPGKKSDPRKPKVDVLPTKGHENEIGLTGVTDENESVLHVYPRLSVSWLCDSWGRPGEACLAVVQKEKGGVDECARDDRFNATCRRITPPQFAVCDGGANDGMPCTRPSHCPGLLASCNGKPQCRKKGAVWVGKKEKQNAKKEPKFCTHDSVCDPSEQCGYSLFNLDDRSGKNLTAKINAGAGKVRRGVCNDSGSKYPVCTNAGSGKACGSGIECTGYRLEALGIEK